MSTNTMRTRFAPSPTGSLHIGGARTALYNYLLAKKYGGQFIVRVEDTDQERSTEHALRAQLADLDWLGLHWDEGLDPHSLIHQGEYGPYRQSERLTIYQQYAQQLLDKNLAYYCFLTDEEVAQQKQQAKQDKRPYQIRSPYRDLAMADAQKRLQQGDAATIRFKTPTSAKAYQFDDLVRGTVTFPSDMVADFVIMRASGMPVYNFACVIDDGLMKISHVLRAEEHLSNTLRQLMLYEALDWPTPQFGHVSIILGDDKKKLSKRQGAVSCDYYRQQGYLPEAVLNYVALLGWTDKSGKDIFNLAELIDTFSIERLNASSAIFDLKKLTWVNSQHIKRLSTQQLWDTILPFLNDAQLTINPDPAWQTRFIDLFGPNLETLANAVTYYQPLDDSQFAIDQEASEVLSWDSSSAVIQAWLHAIAEHPNDTITQENFQTMTNQIKQNCQVKGKHLFMPIRVAVLGKPHGAELKLLIELLTKNQLTQRATLCLESIQKHVT